MNLEPKVIYRFDRFTLDLVRGGLFAEDGSLLALRPKSFDLLHHMVVHAGQLVDRDELMQAVWPNVFVTDDSITQCVKDIRRALGDETQRLLRTMPRRGYLLDATAACVSADAPVAALDMSTSLAASAPLPAPPADRPMVVILPFENLGGDAEEDYLAAGMTADLVADLTRFHDLYVVSPLGRPRDPRSLDVTAKGWVLPEVASYIVAGSLRGAGGRVRVNVRLDDARTGVSLWAERFERPRTEFFALEEELTERLPAFVASHIQRDATLCVRRRPTDSLDAYGFYLRGRELQMRMTKADTLTARAMFAQAIALDPVYAAAYAWQAFTVQRGFTHLWGEPSGRAAVVEALVLARRAVEIDPSSSLSLGILAFVLMLNEEWDEALDRGRAAVHANPCAAEARYDYGIVLTHAGDPVEAEREIRLALSLNPFHPPTWRSALGRALLAANRPQEALAHLRFCAARVPDYAPGLKALAIAAAEIGNHDEACTAVAALARIIPGLTVRGARETLYLRSAAMIERALAGLRAGGMPEG
jgi:TolB-like protein/tetratricopeptide (TPR) repeat protein